MKEFLLFAFSLLIAIPAVAQKTNVSEEGQASKHQIVIYDGILTPMNTDATFKKQGFERYWKWIVSHVQYPSNVESSRIQGTVRMKIIIEIDGSVTPGEVLESPDERLTDEVVRAIKSAPNWTPGTLIDPQSGEVVPVRVSYILPVEFKLRPEILHGSLSGQWETKKDLRPYGSN